MPAESATGLRASPHNARRKQELPSQALAGAWVLSIQCNEQKSKANAACKVLLMQPGHPHQLAPKARPEAIRQQGGTVLASFSRSDMNQPSLEVWTGQPFVDIRLP